MNARLAFLALVLSLTGVAPAAQGVDSRPRQVSGRVEVRGSPRNLEQLRVTLYRIGSRGRVSSRTQSTHPNRGGQFAFAAVIAGIYLLQVDGPGIVRTQWGAIGPERTGRALVLGSRDDIRSVRVIATSRPVICGQVFAPEGKPLPRAGLIAYLRQEAFPRPGGGAHGSTDQVVTATANIHGRYRLDNLGGAAYLLQAYDSNAQENDPTQPIDYWINTTDPGVAIPIRLEPNGERDTCPYDLHLRAPPSKPSDGPRYRVEGALYADASTFASKQMEWALESTSQKINLSGAAPKPQPFSWKNPTFAFRNVPPGRYTLRLKVAPGAFSGPCLPFERVEVEQEVTVTADLLGLRVELRPAASIVGRVEEVHSSQDVQASSVHIRPENRYRVELTRGRYCTSVGVAPDGSFALTDIDPGLYELSVRSFELGDFYTARVELNGAPPPGGAIQLQPGENSVITTERFDFGSLNAFVGTTAAESSASGQVRREHGDFEEVLIIDAFGKLSDSTIRATAGKAIALLPPGRYVAVARLYDSRPRLQPPSEAVVKAMSALGTAFVVAPKKTSTVTLTDRTVEIQNAYARSGAPI
jgi:hypothetical protein